jgi:tRNA threonylcarbamoyladenosine biosynthesis protein TsaE
MALLDRRSFEATSSSEEQTLRLGARLGAMLPAYCVVALQGEMGAGKTAFARGLGEGWRAEQPLRSPSFALIQKHRRPNDRAVLYHVDLQRIESNATLAGIGLRELMDDEEAVFIIEWPERAEAMLPPDALRVRIRAISETKRQFLFSAKTDAAWNLLVAFRKSAFGV